MSRLSLHSFEVSGQSKTVDQRSRSTRREDSVDSQEVLRPMIIGREFLIGKARFRGQNYCDPCLRPSRLSGKKEKFLEAFSDRGGLVAEIIEGGMIKRGDLISLKELPQEAYYYRNRQDT